MKKVLLLFVLASLVFGLAACNRTRLKVYMPGEYIDSTLVRAFEKEYGVRVDIITFDSNESAIPQIKANVYDVIVPSDYAIEELVSEGLLEEIDWELITNLNVAEDLDPALLSILTGLKEQAGGFDLLKYGVPYFWGNVGILYNTETVALSFLEEQGWNALRHHEYDVMFYDSSRDSFMIALMDLYGGDVDINNPTQAQLNAAEAWLIAAKGPNTQFLTDEVLDDMLHPARHDMAVVYSGDAVYLMYENDQLGYYVPDSGTNVWVDAFVVPLNSSQRELAYAFINFMVSFDAMLDNTFEIAYTSPRADVIAEVIADGEYDIESYVIIIRENDQLFRYNTALKQQIEQAWARVRAA
ncbi:MAG: extracellular solute-binding protein [Acholeplasmataceae bacterium]|nr:MAG: extracellular solute-binding protein [Acholeplasmataceae bacterium]